MTRRITAAEYRRRYEAECRGYVEAGDALRRHVLPGRKPANLLPYIAYVDDGETKRIAWRRYAAFYADRGRTLVAMTLDGWRPFSPEEVDH